MKHLLGIIGMAITMSIASQSAVAFDGKTYSPPNVVPPFLIMNSLGLEVALFDAFGDGIKLPKEVLFKYVYIRNIGGYPILIKGIDIENCLFLDGKMPFVLKSGDKTGFIVFGLMQSFKRLRDIYPCKPMEVTIKAGLGDMTFRF